MTTKPPAGDPRVDVEALHRDLGRGPAIREGPEPTEGNEPTPWWLWVLSVVSLFISGVYLGRHSGPYGALPHTGFGPPATAEERPELARPPSGAELYASRCASCHQADARGLPGAFPPLVGSEWVTGPPEVTVSIVLLGLAGPLEVGGVSYNGTMPAWAQLSDDEVAAIVSYVRELSGAPAVGADLVAGVRQAVADEPSPLTPERLRALANAP